MTVMMECGHTANAEQDGRPVCVICAGMREGWDLVAERPTPDLTDRLARCSCGRTQPSSTALAFFEYRGEGSRAATDSCGHCGYSTVAHTQETTRTQKNVVERGECPGFEPRGAWEFDNYYCGCRGWD